MSVEIIHGDAVAELRKLPANSVHCVVTSPPYWGLRDYGTGEWGGGDPACEHVAGMARQDTDRETPGGRGGSFRGGTIQFRDICGKCGARRVDQQIGLEPSPEAWAARLVEVFREVRQVLRKDGCLWLNVGDSYAATTKGTGGPNPRVGGGIRTILEGQHYGARRFELNGGLKPKDLVGAPWLLAFALRADGWWLRSEIIWAKSNPMPESVTDRPTKSHEQVFLLTKSGESTFWLHRDLPGTRTRPAPDYRWVHKETGEEVAEDPGDPENWKRINLWSGRDYFYDQEAVREAHVTADDSRNRPDYEPMRGAFVGGGINDGRTRTNGASTWPIGGRNLRSVWTIATEAYSEAHFATFPTELARRCILAGTSAKGCCPQCAAPWARVVDATPSESQQSGNGWQEGRAAAGHHGPSRPGKFLNGHSTTTGWAPTCACDAGEPVPATVLDPFGGSGTTGLVAEQCGHNAIMIELSPSYAEMSRRRIDHARARRAIGRVDERPATLPGQLEFSL